jgi:hypothetical protein
MRWCLPTSLAAPGFFAHHSRLTCIPSLSRRKTRLAYISSDNCSSPFLLLVLITDYIAAPFSLRAAFLRLVHDTHSLYESGTQSIRCFLPVVEDRFSHRGISGLSLAPIAVSDTPVRSGKNWLAIQEYGRQMSHRVSPIYDRAQMRNCLNVACDTRGTKWPRRILRLTSTCATGVISRFCLTERSLTSKKACLRLCLRL